MSTTVAGSTRSLGYGSLGGGVPVHQRVMAAAAPPTGGRQLNASQPFNIGGPAQMLMGRTAHMMKGISEGRGPGGGLPAAAGEAAEGAAGIGTVAEEAAPLLMAA
jgi:hypothetical protein